MGWKVARLKRFTFSSGTLLCFVIFDDLLKIASSETEGVLVERVEFIYFTSPPNLIGGIGTLCLRSGHLP